MSVVLEEAGGATSTVTIPSSDFEPGERGVMLVRRFIPWHRVQRFWWDLAPKQYLREEREVPHVRLVIEDGTADGEVILVEADLFEVGTGAVTVVLQTPMREPNMVSVRRLGVPWHRLREYERIAARPEDLSVPDR